MSLGSSLRSKALCVGLLVSVVWCMGCATDYAKFPSKNRLYVTTGDGGPNVIKPGYDTVGEIRLTKTGFTFFFIPIVSADYMGLIENLESEAKDVGREMRVEVDAVINMKYARNSSNPLLDFPHAEVTGTMVKGQLVGAE